MPVFNTEVEKVAYLNWYLGFERIFGLPENFPFDIKLANEERLPDVKSFRSVPVKDRNEAFNIIEQIIIPGHANAKWRERIKQQMRNDEITVDSPWLHVIRHDL